VALIRNQGPFEPASRRMNTDHPDLETTLTVVTWNVLNSRYRDWPKRRETFEALLSAHSLDILCCQEASGEQVAFFDGFLAGYESTGAVRPDGEEEGERCPVFFNAARFEQLNSGVFWLGESDDGTRSNWTEWVPRFCVWVALEDRETKERFRVYNAHLPLHPSANQNAAQTLVARVGESDLPAIVCGDFNHRPRSNARAVLTKGALRCADRGNATTKHLLGWGLVTIDAVLVDERWDVLDGEILRSKHKGIYPSDHFGMRVVLGLD
jgi:endonuclease/exonuclease/phosphatase family metal-dependent hydrolase